MSEQRYIDPYSYPDNDEFPLREAAEEAYLRFSDTSTGKENGVTAVGIGIDSIVFYVTNKKVAENIPSTFRGHPCKVQVVGKVRPANPVPN